jgi:hypothetical protein
MWYFRRCGGQNLGQSGGVEMRISVVREVVVELGWEAV